MLFNIRPYYSLFFTLGFGLLMTNCTNEDNSSSTESTATSTVETAKVTNDVTDIFKDYPQFEVLKEYLKPYPDHLTSIAPNNAVEVKAAMTAYNDGQYEAAIDTFPNYSRRPEQIGYIHLYKGISYLMAGKENDAFKTFQLIRSGQEPAFEVSEWYRALCYVAYNNIYEARRKLEAIVANGTYGKEDAVELLDVLPVK